MTKTYSVYSDTGLKVFTSEELTQLYSLLQCEEGEELGTILTGWTLDDYADNCSDIVKDYYEQEEDISSVVYMLCDKRLSDTYDTCKTYLRCMNLELTDTDFEKYWKECTVENCPLD